MYIYVYVNKINSMIIKTLKNNKVLYNLFIDYRFRLKVIVRYKIKKEIQ